MALRAPAGRSVRRALVCGASGQALLLRFRASFKVSQGLRESTRSSYWSLPFSKGTHPPQLAA